MVTNTDWGGQAGAELPQLLLLHRDAPAGAEAHGGHRRAGDKESSLLRDDSTHCSPREDLQTERRLSRRDTQVTLEEETVTNAKCVCRAAARAAGTQPRPVTRRHALPSPRAEGHLQSPQTHHALRAWPLAAWQGGRTRLAGFVSPG